MVGRTAYIRIRVRVPVPVHATGAMELYDRIRVNDVQLAVEFSAGTHAGWTRQPEPSVYLIAIVIGREKIAQDALGRGGLDSNADLDTARRRLRLLSLIDHSPMYPCARSPVQPFNISLLDPLLQACRVGAMGLVLWRCITAGDSSSLFRAWKLFAV